MITRHVFHDTPLEVAGDSDAARAVIVIQEAFGVNDHIRSVVERFADAGYYAVAPELFHRVGSPEVTYDNFPAAMTAMAELNPDGLREDLLAAAAFLNGAGYPSASIGLVGYCMGGSVTFYGATLGIVGAAATFYGGGIETGRFGLASLIDLAPSLTCAWTGFYGDLDKGIPTEQVEALRATTATTSVPSEIIRYPDAEHGFNCDARPAAYNAAASADAMRRTFEFFAATLVEK